MLAKAGRKKRQTRRGFPVGNFSESRVVNFRAAEQIFQNSDQVIYHSAVARRRDICNFEREAGSREKKDSTGVLSLQFLPLLERYAFRSATVLKS
ncbi:MAG: hypothetical protein OEX02_10095 [Cyclobacteriaceae bacterium]|nr:hypothetical protein [Cyclobacteriaceae bacterium]